MFVGSTFLYQIQKDETILWSVKKRRNWYFYSFIKAAECQIGKNIWDLERILQEKTKKSK